MAAPTQGSGVLLHWLRCYHSPCHSAPLLPGVFVFLIVHLQMRVHHSSSAVIIPRFARLILPFFLSPCIIFSSLNLCFRCDPPHSLTAGAGNARTRGRLPESPDEGLAMEVPDSIPSAESEWVCRSGPLLLTRAALMKDAWFSPSGTSRRLNKLISAAAKYECARIHTLIQTAAVGLRYTPRLLLLCD